MAAIAPAGAIAFALMVVSVGLLGFAAYAGSNPAVANDARVAGDRERTRFIADLSRKVDVHVFALGNPYRVIV
ncbi:MAG TPA: N-acetylmuramoyl-L-alanine amidase, partial [Methyloceanibacter sp.]|nr:N-acetylmuramoyl-L-alanine amidase [Methyloceanibacter sp.]